MDKHLLITGSNRGLGLALTQCYCEAGWQVMACCRSPEYAADLMALLNRYDGLEIFELDVTDEEGVQALALELEDRPLDLLINNAGYYGSAQASFGNINSQEWRYLFDINTIAPFKLTEAFYPGLERAHGIVANLSSKMASMGDNRQGGSYLYRSSKAALNALSKSLAIDLADAGIRVVALHPGWVQTDMGGPNALISADVSAKGIKSLLDNLTPGQSGGFFDYQGNPIPW
jgi:NAD(P)-dependent dehydrogenase (short-subunit alcohol dehydrogenase family)